MMKLYCFTILLGLAAAITNGQTAPSIPLITTNATWKFHRGSSDPSAPNPAAWRFANFDDQLWESGRAPFYYGQSLDTGIPLDGMQGRYSSLFLRGTFEAPDLDSIGRLELEAFADGGFVIWFNGVEFHRWNTPAGEVDRHTLAAGPAASTAQPAQFIYNEPKHYLLKGKNVICVQVVNDALESDRFFFDMRLSGLPPDRKGPRLIRVDPAPGEASDLSRITVTFSEPVLGVDQFDLLLNEAAASAFTALGNSYAFTFDAPPIGAVHARWNANHGITDRSAARNPFDESLPQSSWAYLLIDQQAPVLAAIHPPRGSAVRHLSELELTFSEPVEGVRAGDLLLNGIPATNVTGFAAGPYRFQFQSAVSGPARISWAEAHAIADLAAKPNRFLGEEWIYHMDATAPRPRLILNEILAANQNGLKDEENEPQDWIELFNPGMNPVNLEGWSLTDDARQPGRWVFPPVVIGPKEHLVVLASGKDRTPKRAGDLFHMNFKLSAAGEYLGLYNNELPRLAVDEMSPRFPEQRNDYSYGRTAGGPWAYFETPSPGAANGSASISGVTAPVHFSAQRGHYITPLLLHLHCDTPRSIIRFTLDGSEPSAANGEIYREPIFIGKTLTVRAAAMAPAQLPSEVSTHTYLFRQPFSRRSLPALSLVTDHEHLMGRTGIMSVNPRNTTRRGLAWERPVSVEWIGEPGGFHANAGLRIQGGDWVRRQYNPSSSLPFSKYSFRLYFRGDYGLSKLNFPLFPDSPVQTFDQVVLRAGMNDHSNPFITDELVRRLALDTGQVAARGTFASLFLNGLYKGYYNPTERIDGDFLQSWHGGGDQWDIIAQFNEIREGNSVQWNHLRRTIARLDLAQKENYLEIEKLLDLTNFIDYLLVHIYAATGDWPHNNWRAARERIPDAKFRFYIWDAEWSFGLIRNPVTHNSVTTELARTDTDVGNFYTRLRASPEFRLLFADRVQKHFFNGGALSETNVLRRFGELRETLRGVLPAMNTSIERIWVPQRPRHVMRHFVAAGLVSNIAAPEFSQPGGLIAPGSTLSLSSANGSIYYTTDGSDPRQRFSGDVAPGAVEFRQNRPLTLNASAVVKARSRLGETWSALSEAAFQVAQVKPALQITEVMYHPLGGDGFEFVEVANRGATQIDLSFAKFDGIEFSFPPETRLGPGATMILASAASPDQFQIRYPSVEVAGFFRGNLSNAGERLALKDRHGLLLFSVDYRDDSGWPGGADGGGYSLELIDSNADPDDPANWRASRQIGGSPGKIDSAAPAPSLRLNEIMAENVSAVRHHGLFPDWVELHNASDLAVDLTGWSLSDDGNARKFVWPSGHRIEPGGYALVWCDQRTDLPGLHTGFALNKNGESLFLYDPSTNRIDALTFGWQVPDFSLGRAGEGWLLTRPTPGQANAAALLADPARIVINEWMARPDPPESPWFELFNSDAQLPAALRGLFVRSEQAVGQFASHSFIAPGGFVRWFADERPGLDHVEFLWPPSRAAIRLLSSTGQEIHQVSQSTPEPNISEGRFPDGAAAVRKFPNTPSPGAPNFALQEHGVRLNELLVLNTSGLRRVSGRIAPWLELNNPTGSSVDLSGLSLAVEKAGAKTWSFPTGTRLGADSYLIVWFDSGQSATQAFSDELNSGLELSPEGGGVYLFDRSGQLHDLVEYGFQLEDRTVGRLNQGWVLLSTPTPGSVNAAAAELGDPFALRLNEWMANPAAGDDWFEIHNAGGQPVDLSGMFLSDDPSLAGQTKFQVGPLNFIEARGWVRWKAIADARGQPGAVNFSLNRQGESLRIYSAGQSPLDEIDFGPQSPGVSQGRLPDGGAAIQSFATTSSPGASNHLPLEKIVINEILTHADPPLEDAVELHNPTGLPVDLSGWFLSDNAKRLAKYQFPERSIIPARGYWVVYESQFNSSPGSPESFALNSARGEEIHLSEVNADGRMTGFRTSVAFGPAENGVSLGRHRGSESTHFVALERRTFGVDQPATLDQFRLGTGLSNAPPKVGPVIISEIHYHPAQDPAGGKNDSLEEFIELQNITPNPVALFDPLHPRNTWQLGSGVEFDFPPGTILPAHGFLLVVSFDPKTDSPALSRFQSKFSPPPGIEIVGPFKGKLDNAGESVELFKPDPPQTSGPDFGLVPMILVERVRYQPRWPWPAEANGSGASLQRKYSHAFGNDPLHWSGSLPTAGRPAQLGQAADSDADRIPDVWESSHGFNPHWPGDAELDADSDGLNNRDEFLAGTDPRNSASRLALRILSATPDLTRLQFEGAAKRTYTVQYSVADSIGIWRDLTHIGPLETAQSIEVHDQPEGSGRYYRLVTPRQQN